MKYNKLDVPYIIIRASGSIEATRIVNKLPCYYYVRRKANTDDIIIAGGMLIKNRKGLRKAIKQLESTVNQAISFPYLLVESGKFSLKPCKRLLDNGLDERNSYGYLPSISIDDDKVGVFSVLVEDKRVSYLATGTLIDADTVSVPYKFIL